MAIRAFLVLAFVVGLVSCDEKKEGVEHLVRDKSEEEFVLRERAKSLLLKDEKVPEEIIAETIEWFLNKNPNVKLERECYAKLKPGQSIDFVIDVAASPSMDEVDKMCARHPLGLFLQHGEKSTTKKYFDAIGAFIDIVTYGMRPENTHSIIYDNGRRYFIRGRSYKDEMVGGKGGEFADEARNLKTLWPASTKSKPESYLRSILDNNLGRMTKLSLWNRDNGLPSVLFGSKLSKAVYTVVITDGASGAKINDLTNDLERTTVIDIGNERFVKNMNWENMSSLASVVTLQFPQLLKIMSSTARMMACRFLG